MKILGVILASLLAISNAHGAVNLNTLDEIDVDFEQVGLFAEGTTCEGIPQLFENVRHSMLQHHIKTSAFLNHFGETLASWYSELKPFELKSAEFVDGDFDSVVDSIDVVYEAMDLQFSAEDIILGQSHSEVQKLNTLIKTCNLSGEKLLLYENLIKTIIFDVAVTNNVGSALEWIADGLDTVATDLQGIEPEDMISQDYFLAVNNQSNYAFGSGACAVDLFRVTHKTLDQYMTGLGFAPIVDSVEWPEFTAECQE